MFDPSRHYATNPSRVTYDNTKSESPSISVATTICRMNYPQLHEAKLPKDAKPADKPKFSAMLLFHALDLDAKKVDPAHHAMVKTVFDMAARTFGDDWRDVNAEVGPTSAEFVHMPFRPQAILARKYEGKGDPTKAQFDVGGSFLRASTQIQPAVTNSRNVALPPGEVRALRSGHFVIAELSFYTYKRTDRRGVTCHLRGIQTVAPGLPFGDTSGTTKTGFGVLDIPAHDGVAPEVAAAAGAGLDAQLFG
jgi:hypothetical protein